ncbi:MAG: phosphoribosylamine--glycine ligase [Candidatus Omnitrophica bacterium]|nr:phosphoribosylamine--glycine ligase [Candidatus Omnitrophota bacterium]
MKVLVIGGGGREHAIAHKASSSQAVSKILAIPGNGGISNLAECFPLDVNNIPLLVSFAQENRVDLTIVGPENPLAKGIVDAFNASGLSCFGPVKKAACLEASKIFAKEFMTRNGVRTASFSIADSFQEALFQLNKRAFPVVIKYDGLAAGKGVRLVSNRTEAVSFLEEIFERNVFSSDSPRVLIEQALVGQEVSFLIVTDTVSYQPLAAARDYKRVFDGNQGPNTGGMGAYCPSTSLDQGTLSIINQDIVKKTLNGLAKEGIEYRGVLYFGLMITREGIYVLEYNCRFGDPETQVILPLLENDIIEVFQATISGSLQNITLKWKPKCSVCVILASSGYPGAYQTGYRITGLEQAKDVLVYHSGTRKIDQETLVTAGGRVLGVVGVDNDFKSAREKAYLAAEKIEFEGKFYRKDIASEV